MVSEEGERPFERKIQRRIRVFLFGFYRNLKINGSRQSGLDPIQSRPNKNHGRGPIFRQEYRAILMVSPFIIITPSDGKDYLIIR